MRTTRTIAVRCPWCRKIVRGRYTHRVQHGLIRYTWRHLSTEEPTCMVAGPVALQEHVCSDEFNGWNRRMVWLIDPAGPPLGPPTSWSNLGQLVAVDT